MKKMVKVFFLAIFVAGCFPFDVSATPPSNKVVIVEMSGEIDPGQAVLVLRGLDEAEKINARAFILQMDTFGGLVFSATTMRDRIIESKIPTICYIKNRAWSAGALIALAHQKIVIAPGGSIGAAEPIPTTEKTIAAVRAEFAATATRTGRDPKAAEAMVDKTLGYKDIAKPGQILALTDYQAKEAGYADFIAKDRDEMLSQLGLSDAEQIVTNKNWREWLAVILSKPAIKALLLGIIIFAIIAEVKMAGTGIGAGIAVIAAALFFASSFLVGLSGWIEPLLFFVGIALLIIEIFVPGFGIFGIAGISSIVASFFLVLGGNASAIMWLALSILIGLVCFLLVMRKLPKSKLWNKFVLKNASTKEEGFSSNPDYEKYLGQEGTVLTQLRPGGTAEIAGEKLDVLASGEFVQPGTRITVVKVEGSTLFVKPI